MECVFCVSSFVGVYVCGVWYFMWSVCVCVCVWYFCGMCVVWSGLVCDVCVECEVEETVCRSSDAFVEGVCVLRRCVVGVSTVCDLCSVCFVWWLCRVCFVPGVICEVVVWREVCTCLCVNGATCEGSRW